MTSTNDGKDVKSNQTSGPKGKTYYIELYKSLEARLSEGGDATERTRHLCEAWRRVHSLCQHSAPSTHPHLLSWIQRHTARTVLQTEWQTDKRKEDRASLEHAIDGCAAESEAARAARGSPAPWEAQLAARGAWFKRMLDSPWDHPVLTRLLNPSGDPPTDDEVLEWLKEERGVTFLMRLHTLVGEKCEDIAMSLANAVMERVRVGLPPVSDSEEPKDPPPPETAAPTFGDRLKDEAGFTADVWETITDIEFVLLHKRDSKRCIALAKQTPLLSAYHLIERLQKRLEVSPREKRLWKNAKEVAILIAQVVIARCMMVPNCAGASRTALYCCARFLARLLASRLPGATDALANQAPTARHLHTLAQAIDKQLSDTEESMKPYVCELYVRAITAGMNELERLKLKTEKEAEARLMEKTLASWFVQLGDVLSRSARLACECALTAFSLHPSRKMYERLDAAPQPAPIVADTDETKEETVKSEFGSWASDSRSQTNFVKTSETLNMKHTQNQANVMSTAIFNEGEALGLSPELCQDIAVLLSGPRVKTLSWDMDRTLLLENCRAHSEQTHGGTRVLTRELKYLNIDPTHYQHLPEDIDEDENDPYYGIERGYEHLVPEDPEEIWEDAKDPEKTETASSSIEDDYIAPRRKKKNKPAPMSSDEDSDPLSFMAEAKRIQKKKERPHSKERSKERAKKKHEPVDPLDINVQNTQMQNKKDKPKKERKKKEKATKDKAETKTSLASLVGVKVGKKKKKQVIVTTTVIAPVTDSDYDSQGKCSLTSVNSEGNDHDGQHEDLVSVDQHNSSERGNSYSLGNMGTMKKNEFWTVSEKGGGRMHTQTLQRLPSNVTKPPYIPSVPNFNRGQSPTTHIRSLSPNIQNSVVRSSLTKLLDYRRQRNAMEHALKQQSGHHMPPKKHAILRPDIQIQTNVSPKFVDIPEIPKSYIKNQLAEKMGEFRKEVELIPLQRQKRTDSNDSVIQYAKKSDCNIPSVTITPGTQAVASRSGVQQSNTNSLKLTDFVNVPYDRLMAEISERHVRSNDEIMRPPQRQYQPGQLQRSYSVLTPGQRDYQNFLKGYERSKNTLSDCALDMSAKRTGREGKKEIMPISRVVPVVPNMATKPEPKTPQCAKQSTPLKKPETSLNTFSRLSYLHKNKQTEIKNKNIGQKPTFNTTTYQEVSSELDEIIKEQIRVKQAKNDKVDRFQTKPLDVQTPLCANSTNRQELGKGGKDYPLLSNMLQKHPSAFSNKSMYQIETPIKNNEIQQEPVSPPKSSLSDKDQNDLLNLLRQQNKLNFSVPYSSNLNSKPSTSKSNNAVTNNISSMTDYSSKSGKKQELSEPANQPNTSYQSILETKLINIISNTLIKQQNRVVSAKNSENVKTSSGFSASQIVKATDSINKNTMSKCTAKKNPANNIGEIETPEWQVVMSNLLKHKTPARDPNTLDEALNKSSFELAFEKSLQEPSMFTCEPQQYKYTSENVSDKLQVKPDRPKTASGLAHNVIITNKGLKIQTPKAQKASSELKTYSNTNTKKLEILQNEKITKHNHSEIAKKLPQDVQRKQFIYAVPKHDDPFISGIRNSDYDLLEELMDDDLRKEIGELSSDDESYNVAAQSFLKSDKSNEKRVSVEFNKPQFHNTAVKKAAADLRCLNARQPSRNTMQSAIKKPVVIQRVNKIAHGSNAIKMPDMAYESNTIKITEMPHGSNTIKVTRMAHGNNTVKVTEMAHGSNTINMPEIAHGNNTIKMPEMAHGTNTKKVSKMAHGSNTIKMAEMANGNNTIKNPEMAHGNNAIKLTQMALEHKALKMTLMAHGSNSIKMTQMAHVNNSVKTIQKAHENNSVKMSQMAHVSNSTKTTHVPHGSNTIKIPHNSEKVANYKIQDNVNLITSTCQSAPAHITTTPNTENQVYTKTVSQNQMVIDPNVYISTVPQQTPLQNVMLIGSEVIYETYSAVPTPVHSVSNIASSAYVAINNAPSMTLYQTTQFAAPVTNPLIIGGSITVPIINKVQRAAMPAQPTVIDVAQSTHPVIVKPENSVLGLQKGAEVAPEIQIPLQNKLLDGNKAGERKVLSEVQKFAENEKTDNQRSQKIENDMKTNASSNEERLRKKRLAIINRKIIHRCGEEPIPLNYSPLPVKTLLISKKDIVSEAIPLTYTPLSTNEDKQKASDCEAEKLITQIKNNLQDLSDSINDIKSPATPDSTESKENKNIPITPFRRILLRSSSKIITNSNTENVVSERTTNIKTKATIKSNIAESSVKEDKTNKIKTYDRELNAPKRVSKRLRNKTLTIAKEEKIPSKDQKNKFNPAVNLTAKSKVKRKLENKTEKPALSSIIYDDAVFDIETELLGSKISKSVTKSKLTLEKPNTSEDYKGQREEEPYASEDTAAANKAKENEIIQEAKIMEFTSVGNDSVSVEATLVNEKYNKVINDGNNAITSVEICNSTDFTKKLTTSNKTHTNVLELPPCYVVIEKSTMPYKNQSKVLEISLNDSVIEKSTTPNDQSNVSGTPLCNIPIEKSASPNKHQLGVSEMTSNDVVVLKSTIPKNNQSEVLNTSSSDAVIEKSTTGYENQSEISEMTSCNIVIGKTTTTTKNQFEVSEMTPCNVIEKPTTPIKNQLENLHIPLSEVAIEKPIIPTKNQLSASEKISSDVIGKPTTSNPSEVMIMPASDVIEKPTTIKNVMEVLEEIPCDVIGKSPTATTSKSEKVKMPPSVNIEKSSTVYDSQSGVSEMPSCDDAINELTTTNENKSEITLCDVVIGTTTTTNENQTLVSEIVIGKPTSTKNQSIDSEMPPCDRTISQSIIKNADQTLVSEIISSDVGFGRPTNTKNQSVVIEKPLCDDAIEKSTTADESVVPKMTPCDIVIGKPISTNESKHSLDAEDLSNIKLVRKTDSDVTASNAIEQPATKLDTLEVAENCRNADNQSMHELPENENIDLDMTVTCEEVNVTTPTFANIKIARKLPINSKNNDKAMITSDKINENQTRTLISSDTNFDKADPPFERIAVDPVPPSWTISCKNSSVGLNLEALTKISPLFENKESGSMDRENDDIVVKSGDVSHIHTRTPISSVNSDKTNIVLTKTSPVFGSKNTVIVNAENDDIVVIDSQNNENIIQAPLSNDANANKPEIGFKKLEVLRAPVSLTMCDNNQRIGSDLEVVTKSPTLVNKETVKSVPNIENVDDVVVISDEIKENHKQVWPHTNFKGNELPSKKIEVPGALAISNNSQQIGSDHEVSNETALELPTTNITANSEVSNNITAKKDDDIVILDQDSVSKAPVVKRSNDASQTKEVTSKVTDVSYIPQSFKDSIHIEHLPSDVPLKKSVRVSLPNGRKFKATVYGEVHVTFDSLFTIPSIKSALLNGLECKKLYTMNIKQVTTVAKNDPSKILSAQILDIKTTSPTGPVETIDLLSDDEDGCPNKENKTHAQVFETEYGKYKISPIDQDAFIKHQDQLKRKSFILLKKVDSKPDNEYVKVPKEIEIFQNNLLQLIPDQYVTGLMDDIQKKLTPAATNLTADEVVEIDDSSNDSCDLEDHHKPVGNMQPDKAINDLKNVLLKELGVEEVKTTNKILHSNPNELNKTRETEKNSSIDDSCRPSGMRTLSDMPLGECCAFADLTIKEQQQITSRECIIQLTRCDDLPEMLEINNRNALEQLPITIEVSDDESLSSNVTDDEPLTITEDFSVLNDLDTKIVESEARSSSPVIELLDVLVSLDNTSLTHSESAVQQVISLPCEANWFTTKPMLHFQGLKNNVLVLPDILSQNCNEILETWSNSTVPCMSNEVTAKSQPTWTNCVPSLTSLVMKYFQTTNIINQYNLLRNASRRVYSLKRKSTTLKTCAPYKVPKLNEKILKQINRIFAFAPTITLNSSVARTPNVYVSNFNDSKINLDIEITSAEKSSETTKNLPDTVSRNIDEMSTPATAIKYDDIRNFYDRNKDGKQVFIDDCCGSLNNTVEIDSEFDLEREMEIVNIEKSINSIDEDNRLSQETMIVLDEIASADSGGEESDKTKIDSASEVYFPSPVVEITQEKSPYAMIESEENDEANNHGASEVCSPTHGIEVAHELFPEPVIKSNEYENADVDHANVHSPTLVMEVTHVMSPEIMYNESDEPNMNNAIKSCSASAVIEARESSSEVVVSFSESDDKANIDAASEARSPTLVIEKGNEMSPEAIIKSNEYEVAHELFPEPVIKSNEYENADVDHANDVHSPTLVMEVTHVMSPEIMYNESDEPNMNNAIKSCSASAVIEARESSSEVVVSFSESDDKANIDAASEARSPTLVIEKGNEMSPEAIIKSNEYDKSIIDSASEVHSSILAMDVTHVMSPEIMDSENAKPNNSSAIKSRSASPVIEVHEISSEAVVKYNENDKANIDGASEVHSSILAMDVTHVMSPEIMDSENAKPNNSSAIKSRSASPVIEVHEISSEAVVKYNENDKANIDGASEVRTLTSVIEAHDMPPEAIIKSNEYDEAIIDSASEAHSPILAMDLTHAMSPEIVLKESGKLSVNNAIKVRSACPVIEDLELSSEPIVKSIESDEANIGSVSAACSASPVMKDNEMFSEAIVESNESDKINNGDASEVHSVTSVIDVAHDMSPEVLRKENGKPTISKENDEADDDSSSEVCSPSPFTDSSHSPSNNVIKSYNHTLIPTSVLELEKTPSECYTDNSQNSLILTPIANQSNEIDAPSLKVEIIPEQQKLCIDENSLISQPKHMVNASLASEVTISSSHTKTESRVTGYSKNTVRDDCDDIEMRLAEVVGEALIDAKSKEQNNIQEFRNLFKASSDETNVYDGLEIDQENKTALTTSIRLDGGFLKEKEHKTVIEEKTFEKWFTIIADHEYATSFSESVNQSDDQDDPNYEIIYVDTHDVTFLSQDDVSAEVEEEIVEMHSDEILHDVLFNSNEAKTDNNDINLCYLASHGKNKTVVDDYSSQIKTPKRTEIVEDIVLKGKEHFVFKSYTGNTSEIVNVDCFGYAKNERMKTECLKDVALDGKVPCDLLSSYDVNISKIVNDDFSSQDKELEIKGKSVEDIVLDVRRIGDSLIHEETVSTSVYEDYCCQVKELEITTKKLEDELEKENENVASIKNSDSEEEVTLTSKEDVSAETILSKYLTLIEGDSEVFEGVTEYEDPEAGTCYVIPIVEKCLKNDNASSENTDEEIKTITRGIEKAKNVKDDTINVDRPHKIDQSLLSVGSDIHKNYDSIEEELAKIVGEPSMNNEEYNVKTAALNISLDEKYKTSYSVEVEDVSATETGVDDVEGQLMGTYEQEEMIHTEPFIDNYFSMDEHLKVIMPKRTYAKTTDRIKQRRKSLKRKLEMSDVKTSEKKYRKGKNIDYPKITAVSKSESAYAKEYKRLIDYCSTVKFSFAVPFHKDDVDVHNTLKAWPIKSSTSAMADDTTESNLTLFTDLEKTEISSDPLEQTLSDEIISEYNENSYTPCNIDETNFNMGFGEGSDRVIQEFIDGEHTTFSAATLSDVKQLQPLLPSDEPEVLIKLLGLSNEQQDQILKTRRFIDHLNLKEKVRSFFKKTEEELTLASVNNNKKKDFESDNSNWIFSDLTSPRYIQPPRIEIEVNVVQVGQSPVSAAAQNPVTCDPRVTHVSNVSPQCSPENNSGDELQTTIKTEYTELTTANITLPLMQEYAQHHNSMPVESQEPTNMYGANDTLSVSSTQIKSVVKIELMEETLQETVDENTDYDYDGLQPLSNGNVNNDVQYQFNNNNAKSLTTESEPNAQVMSYSKKQKAAASFSDDKRKDTSKKTDQIVNAMSAAGISETQAVSKSNSAASGDTIPQNVQSDVPTTQANTSNFSKSTINAMALQQALAQILPSPLNQTNSSENNQQTSNAPVLHIVQGNNAQSVINKPNGTQLLNIVQNKNATTFNGTPPSQQNTYSGLSLVDGAIQQNGNQVLHIVNTGNQKNSNAGQLLKRVNLLTNLANVQGSNEQKIVQFVCKSADGKSIQLPHQRSMVLRLQPLDPSSVSTIPKQNETQDLTPSSNTAHSANDKEPNPQEMKSRSLYEENYAKFVQNGDSKTNQEKATSLPKFNQVFGKQVYQDKQNDVNSENLQENSECPTEENNAPLDQIHSVGSPPMLIRKPQAQPSQAQPNLVQQVKQTVGHSNIQTMHGGVIYTRQIPVNLGNGQTINLITVPSTEMVDDSTQKQKADGKFGNHEDPPVIKIVPTNQHAATTTTNGSSDENAQMRSTNEANPQHNPQPQPQPVLTQMRIKLPMLSKAPQMVGGARVVRPAFFQIQRNVIGGANQQVYQQLVLTAAPPLGQSIRVPAQTQKPKTPSETQSSPESQMSSSTLEQLREFDMVLEQVKERSTVQPGTSTSSVNNTFTKSKNSPDTTDTPTPSTSTKDSPTPVLYSVGNTQPLNMVNYVNRKSTITSTTSSSYVRSPDSSGVSESPSSSTHVRLPQTATSDSCASSSCASEAAATTPVQSKPKKKKSKPSTSNANPFNIKNTPKPSTQKPLEDEQTTQRILYILAEYKEQVENSPDKDKPAPRRRNNPAAPNAGSSKRKKSSSGSRRRDMSPVVGEDSCRTMGSEDSSCGTSMGECNECSETQSPEEESPRKVVRRLTFEQQETHTHITQTCTVPQRNVIVADGQAFAVRGATGKPATTVLMPANYLLPVSMVKGGQQIAIVTNRGPKLLVGAGEGGAGGTLLFQRLIGPGGLKPVLARPGVRHIRLPTAALHNLQAFNIATPATTVQPPDSTASPAPATTPPDLIDTRAMSSPWQDREAGEIKPERGNSSPEGSEPWNLPSSSIADDYGYEEIVRTDNMDRTVLDAIPDRYSPDMEAQRIFDKMFDSDSKKSMYDSRCGYDIDASDDDKAYHQVVQRRDGRHTRLTHVSSAAMRHKCAILEHELRLQKSLSEECEDLGVDSPSASELFPEAELLFAPSPAHEQTIDQCHTPLPTVLAQGIPHPDLDDQIATDHLLTHRERHDDLDINLDDVGEIVTVGEDGMTTIPFDHEEFARSHEEFARSHPNTTFHSEPEDGEIPPFTIAQGIKGRPVGFHSRGVPGTVVMAPQTTVISQATVEASGTQNTVKFADIDNMINAMPSPQHPHNANVPSVLVKDRNEGLTKFDRLLNESRELHISNTASAIVHSTGNGTQVIRRVHYESRRDARYLDDRDSMVTGEGKTASDRRDAQSAGDTDTSSSERHPELFWETSAPRPERRRYFSSDSDKCCKSPSDENSDSSGIGAHTRLDSVIKAARTERRRSDGSSTDEGHPPLRTYPPKRSHQSHSLHHSDPERSVTGKVRASERCDARDDSRRRASNRGVVKRGCHCCNGSAAPPKPKKSRPKKSSDHYHSHN